MKEYFQKKLYAEPEVEIIPAVYNIFTITSGESGLGDDYDLDEG